MEYRCRGRDCRILIPPFCLRDPPKPTNHISSSDHYLVPRTASLGTSPFTDPSRRVFINTSRPHRPAHLQVPLFIFLLHSGFQILLRSANGNRRAPCAAALPPLTNAFPHHPAENPPQRGGGGDGSAHHHQLLRAEYRQIGGGMVYRHNDEASVRGDLPGRAL